MNKGDFIYFFMLGVFILFIFFSVYTHELIHKQIYSYYGIESKIEMSIFGGTTIPTSSVNDSSITREDLIMFLHSLNEIMGYYFIIFLAFVFLLFIFFIFLKNAEKK